MPSPRQRLPGHAEREHGQRGRPALPALLLLRPQPRLAVARALRPGFSVSLAAGDLRGRAADGGRRRHCASHLEDARPPPGAGRRHAGGLPFPGSDRLLPRTRADLRDAPPRLRHPYTETMAQAPVLPNGFELPLEPRLPRIGSIDAVSLEERAASLAKRSIKKDAKVFALELAIRCMDLTTLEGADTPGKVSALCSKAVRPDPSDATIPSVAAICVYENLVPTCVERLQGTGVHIASVATGFPSGQYPTDLKVADARRAVELGADEVDMVIDRGAFLSGRYA